jgi:putative ABC transport system substrate-binding protein
MDRRAFISGITLGLLAAPLAVEAQQAAKIARIGWLGNDPVGGAHLSEAFRQGLRDLGYIEGRNVVIEYRWAEGKFERLPALAAELVALKVDVILATTVLTAVAQGSELRARGSALRSSRVHADPS